ncbi:MAG TPA: DUF1361 domain-containing protein [Verrucomicrobiae bacterium]|nr:DUF1361 domain-containing protein [Verrucomicrobiae bacterium]
MYKRRRISPRERIVASLGGLTVVSAGLFAAGALVNRSLEFDYLLWNLFLAWTPLLLVELLFRGLRTRLWSSYGPFTLTLLWLLMLPNSFYMISDFLHVQEVVGAGLLYDVVMFTSCIFTGVFLGFSSLYLVHLELRKRVAARSADVCVAVILFLCSYAIYLGRDLRWNSWDVLTNPAGILFDVSDHLIHPLQNGDMYVVTLSFFVLLGSLYAAGWQVADAVQHGG